MQAYGSTRKRISSHDAKHETVINNICISEEVKRGHSKIKTVTKCFKNTKTYKKNI